MKTFMTAILGLLLAAGGGAVLASSKAAPAMFTPDTVHWVAGTGDEKGRSVAVLVGNRSQSGTFIVRFKLPDGYMAPPHWHASDEYLTVLEGTLLWGAGDTMDKSKATVLPAGSFVVVPKGIHHWAMAKGTTIVQVDVMGPFVRHVVKHGSM